MVNVESFKLMFAIVMLANNFFVGIELNLSKPGASFSKNLDHSIEIRNFKQ